MRRSLPLACLVLACDGAPAEGPDDAEVIAAFEALHPGIYDVWALPLERDLLHDALARSLVGEALTRQYVETWATRVRMAADDVAIRVLAVEHDEVELLERDEAGGVRLDASWLARGVVSHQGHKHPRIHRYRAVFHLVPTADGWRIDELRAKELARVASRVDDLFGEGGDPSEQGFMDPLELLEAGLLDDQPPEGGGEVP